MALDFEPLQNVSLARRISEQIREAIIEGRVKVDERLPTEEDLAEKFGVSRPTIREALKRLAAQNLIRSRRGPTGGTFVNGPTVEEASQALTTATTLLVGMDEFDLAQVAEARSSLELICCKLAATRRKQDHLDRMERELSVQQRPDLSDEDFCASDVRFHRALVDATDNPVLQFVMCTVIEALQPASNLVIFRFRQRETIIDQHQRIVDAFKIKDVAAAENALQEQMKYLKEQYEQAQDWRAQKDAEKGL